MPSEMPKVKITVLKRTLNQELADAYLDTSGGWGICDQFHDGQEFIVEQPWTKPEGFCSWAWADIRGEIMAIMGGADYPWIKERGATIAGCSDWFRPVIFKIARVDDAHKGLDYGSLPQV